MENLNIGISFSGGGYRAATFHLGTLSFLNSIIVGNGHTLLDCISVMSTVSGGTITGLKYMLALAQKQDINAMVRELFDFLYHIFAYALLLIGLVLFPGYPRLPHP